MGWSEFTFLFCPYDESHIMMVWCSERQQYDDPYSDST